MQYINKLVNCYY